VLYKPETREGRIPENESSLPAVQTVSSEKSRPKKRKKARKKVKSVFFYHKGHR